MEYAHRVGSKGKFRGGSADGAPRKKDPEGPCRELGNPRYFHMDVGTKLLGATTSID